MRPPSKRSNEPRINQFIQANQVRVVTDSGDQLGVLTLREALDAAELRGLDLVEIAPQSSPPVCKIMDYGKHRFESQKKQKESRKKQKVIKLKEVKLRPNVGEHDYQVKLKNGRRFIEAGDKVKVSLRFRGREITHDDIARELMARYAGDLEDIAKIEQQSKMEGRQMVMILVPA